MHDLIEFDSLIAITALTVKTTEKYIDGISINLFNQIASSYLLSLPKAHRCLILAEYLTSETH